MKFPPHVWKQIKNTNADQLVRALERDGWQEDETTGADRVFRHPDGPRVSIHYHPGKTYGPNLLKALLADTGWSPKDLKRLKLIKRA